MAPSSLEEQAASVVVALANSSQKRPRNDSCEETQSDAGPSKAARLDGSASDDSSATPEAVEEPALHPYPYFFYRNYSTVPDDDPLTPVTAPGRVPNFPAKMLSILSRPDLADIIAWQPHGRSWRVLKPREFEVNVIPTYFEHAKFSSFIRQANGWGFRRLTQGKDRNSYYHPLFLRGLPHLCKKMKRPGVSEKQAVEPEHEPDLFRIAQEHPLPKAGSKADDDSLLLQCTLQGGPKARMPVYCGPTSRPVAITTNGVPNRKRSDSGVSNIMDPVGLSQHYEPTSIAQMTANRPSDFIRQSHSPLEDSSPVMNPVSYDNHRGPRNFRLDNGTHSNSNSLNISSGGATPSVMSASTGVVFQQIAPHHQAMLPTAEDAKRIMAGMRFESPSEAAQFAAGFAAAAGITKKRFQRLLALTASGAQQHSQVNSTGMSVPPLMMQQHQVQQQRDIQMPWPQHIGYFDQAKSTAI